MEIEHSRESGLVDHGAVQYLRQVEDERGNCDSGQVRHADLGAPSELTHSGAPVI